MSTILKALRQAEKESADADCGESSQFNSRTAIRFHIHHQQDRRFKKRMAYALFIGLLVLIPIGLYWYFPADVDDTHVTASVDKPPTTGDGVDNMPVYGKNEEGKETSLYTGSFTPSHQVQEKHLSTSSNVKDNQTIEDQAAQIPDAVQLQSAPPAMNTRTGTMVNEPILPDKITPEPLQQKAVSPMEESSIAESITAESLNASQPEMNEPEKRMQNIQNPERPQAENPETDILPLTDQSFKIHAISWVEDRRNRLAVINNSVAKEGDYVQGYRLVEIEEAAVILNRNGRHYRLKFKYR